MTIYATYDEQPVENKRDFPVTIISHTWLDDELDVFNNVKHANAPFVLLRYKDGSEGTYPVRKLWADGGQGEIDAAIALANQNASLRPLLESVLNNLELAQAEVWNAGGRTEAFEVIMPAVTQAISELKKGLNHDK